MNANWLFQIPKGDFASDQKTAVQARLEADPGAQSISDEEAEAFFVTAYVLAYTGPETFAVYAKQFGMPGRPKNKAFRRHVTFLILRTWRLPRMQEYLHVLRAYTEYKDLPAACEGPAVLSLDDLVAAYHRRHNVVWLCSLLRLTDRADEIPAFLERLDEWTAEHYEFYLNIGRLMLRRIVDGVGTQEAKTEQSAQHLKAQLKQKSRSVAQARRAMTDQQAILLRQERLRQVKESELTSYLERVRQEVAVAEAQFAEMLTRHAEAEALLRERHQACLTELLTEAERVEAEFAQALGSTSTAWPLAGLRIVLEGDWGEAERLQICSLGGHLVTRSADRADLRLHLGHSGIDRPIEGLFFTPEQGPAGLERLLHRRILPQITHYRPN